MFDEGSLNMKKFEFLYKPSTTTWPKRDDFKSIDTVRHHTKHLSAQETRTQITLLENSDRFQRNYMEKLNPFPNLRRDQ